MIERGLTLIDLLVISKCKHPTSNMDLDVGLLKKLTSELADSKLRYSSVQYDRWYNTLIKLLSKEYGAELRLLTDILASGDILKCSANSKYDLYLNRGGKHYKEYKEILCVLDSYFRSCHIDKVYICTDKTLSKVNFERFLKDLINFKYVLEKFADYDHARILVVKKSM